MNLWNGTPMTTARTTSILDAAEAALERCGAKASPAGISPERVRILMREQGKRFAHVKMPSKPAPERALKASHRKKASPPPKE